MGLTKQLAFTALIVEAIAEWPILMVISTTPIVHVVFACFFLACSYFPRGLFLPIYYVLWKPPKNAFLLFLEALGFRQGGVGKDSYASKYQSKYHKGSVPRDSWFAKHQSFGALGERRFPSKYDEETLEKLGFWWGVFGWALFLRGLNHLAAAVAISA